ncbi:uncharacterized protein LOC126747689 isoform X2 [Anthonomus grandis grandis]|uniref:uncharacterized protein LOC126747689 isoform X2 n=1 Tax=Anthonomus grandis grandis TaxID=2921223 RepID=UPI002165E8DD|nr:uncharacterized protein LOC126747689 isoform X2 [Anthonomus grandis grandis]
MQTLRKKTSPLKFKNETTRFMGDGVSFKAKLIGILEVSEARGDRMCQEALCDLKMAIRAAGEHKQRITVNIALDGLRLRDEKTGDCLYHHPVHKISFIAQDMTDSRAFGYIFGSPDTGHRFFGIKTDKAASQVVIAMRDLFQVVFALKKKEIELAKQHLEKNYLPTSPLFSENPHASSKPSEKTKIESKGATSTLDSKNSGTAVADLVDLELELNSLQQGLNQMERITPSDPFGSKDDPFGDSFISYPTSKLILPPPPSSGRDRTNRISESSNKTPPNTAASVDSASDSLFSAKTNQEFSFSRDFQGSHEEPSSGDWFNASFGNSIFEEPSAIIPTTEPTKDEKHEATKQEIMSQFDVFTELDPLGTGRSKPYIDKKHFFKELKNPPKKALNELATAPTTSDTVLKPQIYTNTSVFSSDPFGEDPFVKDDPFAGSDFTKQDPFETEFALKELSLLSKSPKQVNFEQKLSSESEGAPEPPPRPAAVILEPPPLPPKKQGDIVLKPPPRPPHSEESEYLESVKEQFNGPPLPLPQRKLKFDDSLPPERPRKQQNSSDEDYLTPISFPPEGGTLLPPPPHRSKKVEVTVASLLESKPVVTNTVAGESSLDGLDMTLSQLTLSGLNELATKLKIPPHKLSNMTLVQLTSYLSSFIKTQSQLEQQSDGFQADFAANFNNNNNNNAVTSESSYDRYAVFRELQEEIKQTKIDTEPEEIKEEKEELQNAPADDKYAALRDIVEIEIRQQSVNERDAKSEEVKINLLNKENGSIIEYKTPEKSPARSPVMKSPVPSAITELIQSNARLNSGSLSDVLSGSSPEVDNTGSNSDIPKKNLDPTGESWAIFDQPSVPSEAKDNLMTAQSEEGVSPWSSDSKEFGNRSPIDWKTEQKPTERRKKQTNRALNQEDWWDTSADPEGSYYPANRRSTDSYEEEYYECYERPRRRKQLPQPSSQQQQQQPQATWQQQGGHSSSSRDVSPWEEEPRRRGWGRRGHSFDRRDRPTTADSWDDDEDDYEYDEEHRSRGAYFQRHGSKDLNDKGDRWGGGDERRYRGRRREGSREPKESKDGRWCCPDSWEQAGEHDKTVRYSRQRSNRDQHHRYSNRGSRESQDSPWEDEYNERKVSDFPLDYDAEAEAPHYLSKKNWKQRPSSASETDRKTGEIKSSRHYLGTGGSDGERDRRYTKGARRSRSRDSQYSEPYRHKPEPALVATRSTRSKSRKSMEPDGYVEMPSSSSSKKSPLAGADVEKKPPSVGRKKGLKDKEGEQPPRKGGGNVLRTKSLFDNDFVPSDESPIIREVGSKFNFEKPETEPVQIVNRSLKGLRQQSLFDKSQLRLEKSFKERRGESFQEPRLSPHYQGKPRSPFEDDFSPKSDKSDLPPPPLSEPNNGGAISSIKEEPDLHEEEEDEDDDEEEEEEDDSFTNLKAPPNGRKRLLNHVNLKKSGSVNIFRRESDPFDDDFFISAQEGGRQQELRWTEEFEDSDGGRKRQNVTSTVLDGSIRTFKQCFRDCKHASETKWLLSISPVLPLILVNLLLFV